MKLLTVMKRNLTIKEVSLFLQKEVSHVTIISKLLSVMFPIRGKDEVFTVFHKSVLDWLTDASRSGRKEEESFYIDIKVAHNFFVERLSLQFVRSSDIEWVFPEEKNSYLINHLLDHLDGAGRQLEAKLLLMSLPWMMKTLEERGVSALVSEFKSLLNFETAGNGLPITNMSTKALASSTWRRALKSLKRIASIVVGVFKSTSTSTRESTLSSSLNIAFKMIMEALQLAHDVLSKQGQNYPRRLPLQLYGRLNGILLTNSFSQSLKKSCEKWFDEKLIFQPTRLYLEAPGGALETKFQFKSVSFNIYIYIYFNY
jgi:hypothetical protein